MNRSFSLIGCWALNVERFFLFWFMAPLRLHARTSKLTMYLISNRASVTRGGPCYHLLPLTTDSTPATQCSLKKAAGHWLVTRMAACGTPLVHVTHGPVARFVVICNV